MIVLSSTETATVWDVENNVEIGKLEAKFTFSFSADEKWIVSSSDYGELFARGELFIRNDKTLELERNVNSNQGTIQSISFSNGSAAASHFSKSGRGVREAWLSFAKRIMSAELSIPMTAPSGTRSASAAEIFPSP